MMLLAVIDWHALFFWLFALFTCGFGVAVLFADNIVRMAFYLTLSLGASAGLFFLAGAEFVGAMQLMIYVGGTLVLLIFGVMLTAQSRFVSMKTPSGEWVLSLLVGGSLLFLLLTSAFKVTQWSTPHPDRASVALADSKTSTPIGLGLTGVRVDKLDQTDAILRGGMSGYLLPFVIVSVHLLVVLIGAAYMARPKKRASTVGPMA
jgi:NADH-quinone oxidoreductase subunit J